MSGLQLLGALAQRSEPPNITLLELKTWHSFQVCGQFRALEQSPGRYRCESFVLCHINLPSQFKIVCDRIRGIFTAIEKGRASILSQLLAFYFKNLISVLKHPNTLFPCVMNDSGVAHLLQHLKNVFRSTTTAP